MTLKQVGQLPTWDNLVLRHKIPPQNVLPSVEISDGGLGGAHVASGGGLMLKVEQQQSTNLFFFFWDYTKTWRWPANISIS